MIYRSLHHPPTQPPVHPQTSRVHHQNVKLLYNFCRMFLTEYIFGWGNFAVHYGSLIMGGYNRTCSPALHRLLRYPLGIGGQSIRAEVDERDLVYVFLLEL